MLKRQYLLFLVNLMIGMDSNENVYKQLRIDKQVAEKPSLRWVWDWLEVSSEKVIIIYKIVETKMNIYPYLLEMIPVGGVDSEAVEHSTVVPGKSHGFIVIIPACFI